jgi:hypothetical protein
MSRLKKSGVRHKLPLYAVVNFVNLFASIIDERIKGCYTAKRDVGRDLIYASASNQRLSQRSRLIREVSGHRLSETSSLYSGVSFYLYNEASFLALARLSPVTHSVTNTLKRVVVVTSNIFSNTPVTRLEGFGSVVAVLGTLLYSLAKK